jgi:hypothetical protein
MARNEIAMELILTFMSVSLMDLEQQHKTKPSTRMAVLLGL